jgi:serine/threonine protein kinase/Flp pilus assembly protein TadD
MPSTMSQSVHSRNRGATFLDPVYPEVGQEFGNFHILAELGRGGQGCVYLAAQRLLADRPVVLKLTACDGREHLSLARLQHTHIVPLYFAEDNRAENVRLLCMPYFGSATFKCVVDHAKTVPMPKRSGQHFLDALNTFQEKAPVALPARGPGRQVLARASYVQSVCWIGACLAEALNYAHERGLVHLDIKPSNVLLAVDGQPMLLDFHLAQAPIRPDGEAPEWLGGSPLYMSPEHKAAVNAVRRDHRIPGHVDGRADVYSLGAVLYEALGGKLPYVAETSPRIRQVNSLVTVGLSDIIHKCLNANPAQRYATAAALANDLQRHLTHQPLAGVANRSLHERWSKWRRRRPNALIGMGLVAIALIACGGFVAYRQVNQARIRHQLLDSIDLTRNLLQQKRYLDAGRAAQSGLSLAANVVGDAHANDELTRLSREAAIGQTGQELSALADQLRYRFGAEEFSAAAMRPLVQRCRQIWDRRNAIRDQLQFGPDDSAAKAAVDTDLLDLALLWTDLEWKLALPADRAETRRECDRVLTEAEALFGRSPVVEQQRRLLNGDAPGVAPTPSRRSAWEHYALGRIYHRAGQMERADGEFRRAIALQPQGFWTNFYLGMCAYRLGRFADAVAAFSVCIGAGQANAPSFFNRALAYAALGDTEHALADYEEVLRLDPKLAPALLSRALLYYGIQRYDEATADLRRALELGAKPATVHFNLALIDVARGNLDAAREHLDSVLRDEPGHADALKLREQIARRSKRVSS